MKNNFDFIMFLAFQAILEYEDKRSLTIEQLHNYRVKLYKKHLKYHRQFSEYDDNEFENNLKEFHRLNAIMTVEEELQNLKKFIKNNENMFSYKNEIISIKEGISLDDISSAKFELDSYSNKYDHIICGELIGLFDCIGCLNTLGAKRVIDFVSPIIKCEKEIENAYQTCQDLESQKTIDKLSANVNFGLSLIGRLNDDKMRCYHRVINSSGSYDSDKSGEDIWLLSDNLMEQDEFYKLSSNYIDCILSNKFQRAIFDTGTLVYDKLYDIMDAIWAYRDPNLQMEIEPIDPEAMAASFEEQMEKAEAYKDEFEDDEEISYDDNYDDEDEMNQIELYLYDKKVNMAFYLNYINHIDEYQVMFGGNKILESSKSRLLYLLDGYGDNLYKQENFRNALNNTLVEELDYEEDLNDFYTISRLFLVDILEGWIENDMSLRKMMFVSTYYDLTKDKRIKKIIDKYKENDIGKMISTIIFEHNYIHFNSYLSQLPKKKIKKKANSFNNGLKN